MIHRIEQHPASRLQREQTPAPSTRVSRETIAPRLTVSPLARRAAQTTPCAARTVIKNQLKPTQHPPTPRPKSTVILELFHVKHSTPAPAPAPAGTHARKRATTRQPRTNDRRQQAGHHPSAAPRSMSHAHLRRTTNSKTSPPPLPQPPREDPMPRREDPGEHEARGEHQNDRGTCGHVQRPRQVQAHQAARRPQGR